VGSNGFFSRVIPEFQDVSRRVVHGPWVAVSGVSRPGSSPAWGTLQKAGIAVRRRSWHRATSEWLYGLLALFLGVAGLLSARADGVAAGPPPLADAAWSQRDFWQTTDGRPVNDGWRFTDGEVALVEPRLGGNIVSHPLPSHFELSWSWKIEKGVNSGLKYRVRTFGDGSLARTLGLEYQIIDSASDDTSVGSTAAIYDLVAPIADKVLHPPGSWNVSRVVAIGDRLEHWLNGQLVTSANTAGPAWDTTVALSKFYGAADFGRPRDGDRVMLTDHGGRVTYKDFHFVEHAPPPAAEPEQGGPFLADGSRNSWADQTSIVIWTRTTRNPEMRADGRPFISLSTTEARELAKGTDPAALLAEQLPEGAALDDMFGACPGAPGRVRLSYYPEHQRRKMRQTPWLVTSSEHDCTAQWKLEGLEPGKKYLTVIEAQTPDGEPSAVALGSFQTAFPRDAVEPFTFCVTTCHDFIRRDDGLMGHKIYTAMQPVAPAFIVHAGDIEYYDKPDPWALTKELMRFKWGRLFALPANRRFYENTTSYFIKDDHDTLANDCWPGQRYGAVTFEEGVDLFNNEQFPSRAPRYATVRWGRDLQIWLLEGRDYRSPHTMPDGPEKSILGVAQKAWLLKTLTKSDAPFKLVFSPTPIVGPDRDSKKDNHANKLFAWEGRELRKHLSEIPGVIVCCGDRHWQYASVDEETGLWEFGCGPGSEAHELGWKKGDERPEHRFLRVAGGFLSGEVGPSGEGGKPVLSIRHRTVSGEPLNKFDFHPVSASGKR
jgi:alkaline phosphatase D